MGPPDPIPRDVLEEAFESAKSTLEEARSRKDVQLEARLCLFLADSALRLGILESARAYADQGDRVIRDDDIYLSEALRFIRSLALPSRAPEQGCSTPR